MNRRELLTGLAGSASIVMLPTTAQAATPDTAKAALSAVARRRFEETLSDSPQYATSSGLDVGVHAALRHQLDDRNGAALQRRLARSERTIAALEAIDPHT